MRLRLILIPVAALGGAVLTWWGVSILFASGVRADVEGTSGALEPLPTAAAVVGIAGIVWALCALAWQVGLALQRRRSRSTVEAPASAREAL